MDYHEKCSICLGFFREPRKLPCHHYFCTDCIQNCINAAPENLFLCPLCRAATAPNDKHLPLYQRAKGFPIVNTETKEENPCPFYCTDCMESHLYVDAFAVCLQRGVRLCCACFKKNNQLDQQVSEDHVAHDQQNLYENPVTKGLFFCCDCRTFSYAQNYISKHAVCIANNADVVQPFLRASKEMREKTEGVINNMDDLQRKAHDILIDLSKLGQRWQHENFQKRVLFSMDENIVKNYSKHLTTLDETICETQGMPKRMIDYLEGQKSIQKITDDLEYLKIQSLIDHDIEESLHYKNKLAKIAETTKYLGLSFHAFEDVVPAMGLKLAFDGFCC